MAALLVDTGGVGAGGIVSGVGGVGVVGSL